MPPTYPDVLSEGFEEPRPDKYTPRRASQRGKGHVRAPRWQKTRPCRRGLRVVIGLGGLRGLQSFNQMSLISEKGGKVESYNLVRGAFDICYVYISILGGKM